MSLIRNLLQIIFFKITYFILYCLFWCRNVTSSGSIVQFLSVLIFPSVVILNNTSIMVTDRWLDVTLNSGKLCEHSFRPKNESNLLQMKKKKSLVAKAYVSATSLSLRTIHQDGGLTSTSAGSTWSRLKYCSPLFTSHAGCPLISNPSLNPQTTQALADPLYGIPRGVPKVCG